MNLPEDSLLKSGEYRIIKTLGKGGFGITYEAEQVSLGRSVAIKEFFIKEYCNRNEETSHVYLSSDGSRELVERFKGKFLREARMIAQLNNPHIIKIYDVFEANDTAYYVMEYIPGGSLKDEVEKHGALSPKKAEKYIRQICSALQYLHNQNILHLDIKPSNILIDNSGKAVLIDFGISKHYNAAGQQTSSSPIGLSRGYAPLEQYHQDDVKSFTPATDIYSLGATLYYLLTGTIPPDASLVNEDGLERPSGISNRLWTVIERSMQSRRRDRPQDIAAFLSILYSTNKTNTLKAIQLENDCTSIINTSDTPLVNKPQPILEYVPATSLTPKLSSLKYSKLLLGVISVMVIGLIVLLIIFRNDSNRGMTVPSVKQNITNTMVTPATGIVNGHEWVDLGLSVKWATCNVGATAPENYGDYYAWGEANSNKTSYIWSTYKFHTSGGDSFSNALFSKYNTNNDYGTIDDKYILDLEDDVAHLRWGGTWRMPTLAEQDELSINCTWIWFDSGNFEFKGVAGYKVISNKEGYSDRFIFLPAAGRYAAYILYDDGACGYYWSSSLNTDTPEQGWNFRIDQIYHKAEATTRNQGLSIRPVCQ